MVEARLRQDWALTASLMALIHNVIAAALGGRSATMRQPEDFMPPGLLPGRSRIRSTPPPTPEEREMLRKIFPGDRKPAPEP